jgi:hypothetical protein
VTYYDTVRSLLKTAQEDWPALLARLEAMRDTINAQVGQRTRTLSPSMTVCRAPCAVQAATNNHPPLPRPSRANTLPSPLPPSGLDAD